MGKQINHSKERRWAWRSILCIPGEFYSFNGVRKYSEVTDFSLNGMFLSCRPDDVEAGSLINITLFVNFHETYRRYEIPVKVVRISKEGKEGIGVTFHQYDSALFCCVQNMLLQSNLKQVV